MSAAFSWGAVGNLGRFRFRRVVDNTTALVYRYAVVWQLSPSAWPEYAERLWTMQAGWAAMVSSGHPTCIGQNVSCVHWAHVCSVWCNWVRDTYDWGREYSAKWAQRTAFENVWNDGQKRRRRLNGFFNGFGVLLKSPSVHTIKLKFLVTWWRHFRFCMMAIAFMYVQCDWIWVFNRATEICFGTGLELGILEHWKSN